MPVATQPTGPFRQAGNSRMTTFDKREEAFEKKFAIDEELKFRAEARRNRLLGLWVAEKLGMSGAEAQAYARGVIEEEFGDGIMSAIDFDMVLERLPNPKGDRVKITMSGKFLPYKYYGASGNVPEYGFKEG